MDSSQEKNKKGDNKKSEATYTSQPWDSMIIPNYDREEFRGQGSMNRTIKLNAIIQHGKKKIQIKRNR